MHWLFGMTSTLLQTKACLPLCMTPCDALFYSGAFPSTCMSHQQASACNPMSEFSTAGGAGWSGHCQPHSLCCHLQDFQERLHAEAAAKRAAYEAEVAAGRMATVSQLVKGEVVVRPPPAQGSSSPGRSRSPGEQYWWTVCEVSPGRCRKTAAAA
jgi:hypothetical protein